MSYTLAELSDFDKRMESVYKGSKSPALIREALQFLRDNPNPEIATQRYALSPVFIKRLTKTVFSVPESSAERIVTNPVDLEIAIAYCTHGAELVKTLYACSESRLRSHFLGHAAKVQILVAAFCPDREVDCIEAAIKMYDGAIAFADPSDVEYVAHKQIERARCLLQLARKDPNALTNGRMLAAGFALRAAGTNFKKYDGITTGLHYTLASDMFYQAAKAAPTEEARQLLATAVTLGEEGASLVQQTEPEHYAVSLGNIARYAGELWRRSQDPRWHKKALTLYKEAVATLPQQQESLKRALQFQHDELCQARKNPDRPMERKPSTRRLRPPPAVPTGKRLQDFLDAE